MEHDEKLQRQHEVLRSLNGLPQMMLKLKERDNIPEFVLHDLCHPNCFNLRKAAYFVDNPDFDCLRGVAGLSRDEVYFDKQIIWHNPDDFSQSMQASPFNQKVRAIEHQSPKRTNGSEQELVQKLAQMLGITQPSACTWDMKFDNYGLLIFEKASFDDNTVDEYLLNGVSILSFCPLC
jgi:hypothetical protein